MELSKKQKTFSEFFAAFLKFIFNLKYFEKMTLIADGFPKLQAAKDVVRQMSKKSCFRIPFDSRHVKGFQRLGKLT